MFANVKMLHCHIRIHIVKVLTCRDSDLLIGSSLGTGLETTRVLPLPPNLLQYSPSHSAAYVTTRFQQLTPVQHNPLNDVLLKHHETQHVPCMHCHVFWQLLALEHPDPSSVRGAVKQTDMNF